jgi:hypothetical protein
LFCPILLLFPHMIYHELSKFLRFFGTLSPCAAASQPADQHATLMSRLGKHEIPLSHLVPAVFV